MQIVNTNSFRIVPVCVPSVRKWGAYNMATIIDKFDFKFANRVTISFFFKIRWPCFHLRVAAVRIGRGRRRCWEGLDDYDYGDFDGDDGDDDHDDNDDDLGRLTFPDWLVVKHLGECMEKDNFADLINMMANNLDDVDVDEEKVMVVMMMRRMMRMSMST